VGEAIYVGEVRETGMCGSPIALVLTKQPEGLPLLVLQVERRHAPWHATAGGKPDHAAPLLFLHPPIGTFPPARGCSLVEMMKQHVIQRTLQVDEIGERHMARGEVDEIGPAPSCLASRRSIPVLTSSPLQIK
jgi:hypothetical protein